jgi:hypothetical protein
VLGYTYLVFQMLHNNDINSFTILSRYIEGVRSWHFYGTLMGLFISIFLFTVAVLVGEKAKKAKTLFANIFFNTIVYGWLAILTDDTIIKILSKASSFSDFPLDKTISISLGLILVFYWQTNGAIATRKSSMDD